MNSVIWEAIRQARLDGLAWFDFEGSSKREIEMFFRGFGAQQTMFHGVFRGSNQLLTAGLQLRG